ncbi:MAG: chromosomal replication initiator protein DnaA [Phycisphaerae bacterium]|nr:chromosomal replication initiator protein DnaA [Phycisphaerae bacterium]
MKTVPGNLCAGDDVLRRVFGTLQDRIGPQKYNAWFKHGTAVSVEDGHIKVSVPNPFVANWIEQHYQSDLIESVETHTGQRLGVVVAIDPSLNGQCSKRELDIQAEIVSRATQGRARPRKPLSSPVLKHSLNDFVVGPCNKLAYQAAMTAAMGSGNNSCSQLFVHGSCGVGKTHLLQGICNAISKMHNNGNGPLKWKYVTGEQFTNEFITAVRNKQGAQFREKYRKLDLLAIDDVHFLAAKRATQDEFLHTFNAIESAGKQILLASDAHPRMVGELNEQLVSRFLSGMLVKIESPDRETRTAVLRRKAAAMKLELSEEVLSYVTMHIRGSIRELEGTLVKLSALAALENTTVTLSMARDALSDHLARTDSAITLGDIESVTATFFGITPADIHSSRRTRTVSVARMLAMYLARRHTRMSYPEIGRFMGKNHSSVVLAVQRLEKNLAKNESLTWVTPMGTKEMPASDLLRLLDEQIN